MLNAIRFFVGRLPGAIARRTGACGALAAVCTVAAVCAPPAVAGQKVLKYAAPDNGPVFTITEDGLSRVDLGDRQVAGGRLECRPCFKADRFLRVGPSLPVRRKSITVTSDHEAEVVHTFDAATARYRYTLNGEDVIVKVRLENRHRTATVPYIVIETPDFARGAVTQQFGILPRVRHSRRTFAAWCVSKTHAIGISPDDVGRYHASAWWAGRQGGLATDKETNPQRARIWVGVRVRPGSARTVTVGIRVTPTADWRAALGHYRDVIHARFGKTPQYEEADHRPIMQMVMSKAPKYASPKNPYAMHDHRMIHSLEKTRHLVKYWTPSMLRAKIQGLLVWGQQGSHARECMYRPDCDVLPPENKENFPRLAAMLKEKGMWLGATARPASIAVPRDLTRDWALRQHVDDPTALNRAAGRMEDLVDLGAAHFYLDCLGLNGVDDFKRMQRYREVLGPRVQTYSEYASDAFLALTGVYLHCHKWDAKNRVAHFMWTKPGDIERMQWVYPKATFIGKLAVPAEQYLPVVEWMLQHRITPLVEDYKVRNNRKIADGIAALVEKHLTTEGQWK